MYCEKSNQKSYPFTLPKLPFNVSDFKEYFSSETFDYHYNKHHNAYVTNLNNMIQNKHNFHNMSLENIIIDANIKNESIIFNNAAQIWNHTFFWYSILPNIKIDNFLPIKEQIDKDFFNYDNFVSQFTKNAMDFFGSGWIWLVYKNNSIEFFTTNNAQIPITQNIFPLFVCDLWEHSYYIDFRNKKLDYISSFIKIINWEFVNNRLILIQSKSK